MNSNLSPGDYVDPLESLLVIVCPWNLSPGDCVLRISLLEIVCPWNLSPGDCVSFESLSLGGCVLRISLSDCISSRISLLVFPFCPKTFLVFPSNLSFGYIVFPSNLSLVVVIVFPSNLSLGYTVLPSNVFPGDSIRFKFLP